MVWFQKYISRGALGIFNGGKISAKYVYLHFLVKLETKKNIP